MVEFAVVRHTGVRNVTTRGQSRTSLAAFLSPKTFKPSITTTAAFTHASETSAVSAYAVKIGRERRGLITESRALFAFRCRAHAHRALHERRRAPHGSGGRMSRYSYRHRNRRRIDLWAPTRNHGYTDDLTRRTRRAEVRADTWWSPDASENDIADRDRQGATGGGRRRKGGPPRLTPFRPPAPAAARRRLPPGFKVGGPRDRDGATRLRCKRNAGENQSCTGRVFERGPTGRSERRGREASFVAPEKLGEPYRTSLLPTGTERIGSVLTTPGSVPSSVIRRAIERAMFRVSLRDEIRNEEIDRKTKMTDKAHITSIS
ncbi:hypothetical protein EVAR_58785_1 [Eumeta japonica]|uniref:Uncharacterized protein n=1 Tax=Eumeta variegata TaxID=151549 RepID=A0A4C1YKI4_EUMVA|nr:hypothetical protein EVAR_58785_1 [Eumeta japonica]